MKNPKNLLIINILLALVFLTACAGKTTTQQPTATSTAEPIATSSPKPTVELTPCRVGFRDAECGTLQVYENREAKSGRMIPLKIVVFRATNADHAPDPIFYLAGGPGGAAASEDAKYPNFSSNLCYDHDIVYVDQRGTGGSNEVLIPTNQPDLSGLSPEQADAGARAWVEETLGEINMDPRYYTTSIAVDDLDEVREALGYDKINLAGFSYGTTVAQYYLARHAEHVRTMTLGVGSLLDVPIEERWATNTQHALDGIFSLCLAEASCNQAFPNIKAELSGLMDRLAMQSETVPFPEGGSTTGATITYDVDFFSGTLRNLMKNADNHKLVPLYIHLAYNNDWSGFNHFIARGGGPEFWGQQFMDHVIRCSEKWASFDPAKVAENGQGSFMLTRDLNLAREWAMSCQYTPVGVTPEGIYPQAVSQVPVLLWNGNLDPIDPPANVEGAQELFPNSISLVSPYQGHAINGASSACFNSVEEQFIQSGTVQGLDTSCLQTLTPPSFDLP